MYTAAILTVSDRSFRGERPDEAGPLAASLLEGAGYRVIETAGGRDRPGFPGR